MIDCVERTYRTDNVLEHTSNNKEEVFPPERFPSGSAGPGFSGAHFQQQRDFRSWGCPCEYARFSGGPGFTGAHFQQQRQGFPPERFPGGSAGTEFPGEHFQQQRGGFHP